MGSQGETAECGARPSIEVIEVSPRDGLQNESRRLSTSHKAELIRHCEAAGLRRIEVASFVHPKAVPAMADAEELLLELGVGPPNITHSALVLNWRGYERARTAGVSEINFVVAASQTFSEKNQGMGRRQAMQAWAEIARDAHRAGIRPGLTIATAFGCPFEGEITVADVAALARDAMDGEPFEVCLADTIGVAAPSDVRERFAALFEVADATPLRAHFHDTRNTGLANAAAAIDGGVYRLDASLGGLGGCPFAPRATGNIPTEDLVYMLQRMGLAECIDLPSLIHSCKWLEARMGKVLPGMVYQAGLFPDRETA